MVGGSYPVRMWHRSVIQERIRSRGFGRRYKRQGGIEDLPERQLLGMAPLLPGFGTTTHQLYPRLVSFNSFLAKPRYGFSQRQDGLSATLVIGLEITKMSEQQVMIVPCLFTQRYKVSLVKLQISSIHQVAKVEWHDMV